VGQAQEAAMLKPQGRLQAETVDGKWGIFPGKSRRRSEIAKSGIRQTEETRENIILNREDTRGIDGRREYHQKKKWGGARSVACAEIMGIAIQQSQEEF